MKTTKKLLAGILLGLVIGTATAEAKIPLPADMNIVAPDQSSPEEIRALFDKWQGTWSNGVESMFILEELTGDETAKAIYANDDWARAGYSIRAGWRRPEGGVQLQLEGDGKVTIKMRLEPGGSFIFYFDLKKKDILEGVLTSSLGRLSIRMKRVK